MYSVSAPANACDTRKTQGDDRPTEEANAGDLRIISGSQRQDDFRNTLQNIDPSELAAKILQLHSDASENNSSDIKRPKMVDHREEDTFDMPNVLRKPSPFGQTLSEPGLKPKTKNEPPGKISGGPSFKFLLASTLMIGLAGGAALALGVPEMLRSEEAPVRPVETELIVAAPSVETPSPAATDPGAPLTTGPETTNASSATPAQIAKAKDRIRQAFAVGGSSTPAPVTLADDASAGPTGSPSSTARRVSDNSTPPVSNTEAAPIRSGYPLLASNAPLTPLADPSGSANETVDPSPNQPGVAVEPVAADKKVLASVTPSGSAVAKASYPNAGRTLASVNMRLTEDKDGEIIAVIPEDTPISFNECGTWWCGIEYQGKEGFVGQKYLERTGPQKAIEQNR